MQCSTCKLSCVINIQAVEVELRLLSLILRSAEVCLKRPVVYFTDYRSKLADATQTEAGGHVFPARSLISPLPYPPGSSGFILCVLIQLQYACMFWMSNTKVDSSKLLSHSVIALLVIHYGSPA
jgi:hypothetical protein